jgi:beta-lactamase class A
MRAALQTTTHAAWPALVLAGALLAATVTSAAAQDAHRRILAEKLQTRLDAIAAASPGVFGVHVIDVTSGERFGVNDGLVFPQGSAIKVPVLVELYVQAAAGRLTVDDVLPVTRAAAVPGSQLRHFRDGSTSMALHDLAVLMIIVSDNVATNLLIDHLGMDAVNRTMASLGLPATRLQRSMIRPEESARGNENLSTPRESAALMQRILRCELPIDAASCRELRAILEIPHAGPIQDAVPGGIVVGQKTGSIAGVAVNWGYVDLPGRPYVITAMGNYGDTPRINQAIREASAAVHEYFGFLAGATEYGTRVPLRLLPDPPR